MISISKIAVSGCAAALVAFAAHAGQITVEAGKAKAVKLKANADSVIIGNPNVADVAVHDDKLLFVTGKSFGTTNLMIFDKDGNTLHSSDVVVTANTATWVSVKRAGANLYLRLRAIVPSDPRSRRRGQPLFKCWRTVAAAERTEQRRRISLEQNIMKKPALQVGFFYRR